MLYPQTNQKRTSIPLSGMWDILEDPKSCGEKLAWQKKMPLNTRIIGQPGSYNEQIDELRDYMDDIWYFKKFQVPESAENNNIFLHFGSVNYRATIFVNGIEIGKYEGGYLPFELNITKEICIGKQNFLAVKLNNYMDENTVPQGNLDKTGGTAGNSSNFPAAHYDFFPYGGLNRLIHLCFVPKNRITSVRATPFIKGKTAGFDIEFSKTGKGKVEIELLDSEEKKIKTVNKTSGKNYRIEILKPKLWAPETPYLYTLKLQIKISENTVDLYYLQIGLRTIEIKNNKLCLNGKPYYLKGFGKHEDFHVVGKGYLPALIAKDLNLLKWTGANSFRTSHYPYSEELLQTCDKIGMLVISETPAVSISMEAATPKTLQQHKNSLRQLILRDYNHPSVIMWSVSNESDTVHLKSRKYFQAIAKLTKSLDNSRPIMNVVCKSVELEKTVDLFDVIGVNRYYGWYEQSGRIAEGAKKLSVDLDNWYKTFKKPVFLTEFGADTIAGLHSINPEGWTEEYQSEFLEKYIKVIRSKSFTMGEHVWNFADFKTGQNFFRVVYNMKGVFTRDRRPKLAAFTLKKLWK